MNSRSTPSDQTRPSLLLRLREAGPQREVAWEEFHDLYAPIISGFARRMGARPSEVEDLLQEVLKSFFCVTPEFTYNPAAGRFRAYLKTCVWNKLNQLRRWRGRQVAGSASREPVAPDEVAVEAVWNDVWETEKLGRALAMVRENYSTDAVRQRTFRAFEMCTLLERPTDEVAVELGLSAESVRAARSRISKALRNAFEKLEEMAG
jgi:RNA polymerase sigma factor (sigma-70 family)